MERYDRVLTTDGDPLEAQTPVRAPPGLSLPKFTSAIRARASSFVSDISRSSFHRNSSNSNTRSNSRHGTESSSPLLPSSSPTSPSSSSSFPDVQPVQRAESTGSSSNSSSRGQRTISNQSVHVRLLRLTWLVALFVGEHGSYWAMVHRCTWPENSSWNASDEAKRERYRVAIIADPQLTDWMSYHQSGLLLTLVETFTDIFMKRSFHRMHSSLQPDAVLFLGDLNDGGRISYGDVFEKNKNRFFERIFKTSATAWNQRPIVIDPTATTKEGQLNDGADGDEENIVVSGNYQQLADVPLDVAEREEMKNAGRSVRLYVAGNHDVGFGDTLIRSSMARYKQVFGAVNYEINVGNHSLVVLDTLSLSSGIEDIREESHKFLTQLEKETPTLPRILFTHVPLFRLDTTYCGDARETEQLILDRKGEQYQNMVNITLSRQILRGVQPDMVFSGDDHDWCEIAHSLDGTLTPEVTLPTFSFAQGIQQPGFVMLSLYNPQHKVKNGFPMIPVNSGLPVSTDKSAGSVARPTRDTTFTYEECMLPNQMLIYLCYGVLFACTLNSILVQRFRWMMRGRRRLEEQLVLARWRDSRSPHSSEAMPQGSTTATAISTQHQAQQQTLQEQQERCEDDIVGRPSDAFLSEQDAISSGNMVSSKLSKGIWPLRSSIYWKMVGWDLWNIARYAIPFYIILFVVSII